MDAFASFYFAQNPEKRPLKGALLMLVDLHL